MTKNIERRVTDRLNSQSTRHDQRSTLNSWILHCQSYRTGKLVYTRFFIVAGNYPDCFVDCPYITTVAIPTVGNGKANYIFRPTNISLLHIVNRLRSLPPDSIFW